MSEWQEGTVASITHRVTKGTTPPAAAFRPEGVNYVKVESITTDGRIEQSRVSFVDSDAHASLLARSVLQENDVLFTIAGTIGRSAIVRPEMLPANANQAVAIIRPDLALVRPDFLFYALRQTERVHAAKSRIVQSVQSNLSLRELSGMKVPLPPLPEQRAIAEVLGALDDKIAANTRLAATAEALLRAEIDAHWLKSARRDSTLADYVSFNPTTKHVAGPSDPAYVDMKKLPESGWSIAGADHRPAKGGARFRNGDTLLARITPCLENRKTGYVDVLDVDEVAIGSTEFVVMRPNADIAPPIAFLLATESRFREHAIQHMVGTSGRQRVAASDLASFEMPSPDASWLSEFGVRASSLFEFVRIGQQENRTLAATRDALLPKLMSGQLRVRDAVKIAEKTGA